MLDELARALRESGRLTLSVKVTPRSAKTGLSGVRADGTLRIKVAAVPEKGKANAELCSYLGKLFGVPKSGVRVVSGQSSPRKHIVIEL